MAITKKEGTAMLAAVPMFESLSKRDLGRLWDQASLAEHPEGHRVVTAGRGGVGFHLILDGTARVRRRGKQLLLGPGEFFGEMSLIDNAPRTADIIAETPLVTAVLTRWEFKPLVEDNPKLAWRLMEYLVGRLREEQSALDAAVS